jgi:hypothetical protein
MYDTEDDRGVPISSGIPKLVTWTGVAGVILIFVVAGMVLATAGANHVWPAEASTNLKL